MLVAEFLLIGDPKIRARHRDRDAGSVHLDVEFFHSASITRMRRLTTEDSGAHRVATRPINSKMKKGTALSPASQLCLVRAFKSGNAPSRHLPRNCGAAGDHWPRHLGGNFRANKPRAR